MLQAAAVSGLARGLSRALSPWRPARSVHDPGKTVLDRAVTIALGGDCLADAAVVRAQQLALALALRRGVDPDAPPGLRKVTPTT